MPDTLAQKIRAKYPGVYDDLDDVSLEAKVRAKFPGEYDDIPSTRAQATTTAPAAPSLARRVLTPVADALVGVGKGAANTAIGAGKFMHAYVPPVRVASDLAQRAIFGDVQQAGPLFDAAREAVQPQNTAEKVGFGAEQIAEFFAVPGGAGGLVPRIATQVAGAGGVSALQGAPATAAAVVGGVAGLAPVAGKALESASPVLKQAATRSVEKALGATKERFKAMAAKLAPEFLRRDVGGVLGKSREAIYNEASAQASAAGKAVDAALIQAGGRRLSTQPIVQALEGAKAAYQVPRVMTAQELAMAPELAKRATQLPSGDFEIAVVLDSRPIQQLSRLQKVLSDLGPDATVDQVVAARRAWDAVVDQAGGYAQRAPGAIGTPLRDQSEAWAKREATKAIRRALDAEVPELTIVNKEYAFWKGLKDVTAQTLKRTAPQKGGLGKTVMTAGGMVAGAASGDGVVDRTEKALLAGALANRMDKAFTSARWNLVSARVKDSLAEAIASGSVGRINAAMARVSAGLTSQAVAR